MARASAQLPSTVVVVGGAATVPLWNPTSQPVRVTVALHYGGLGCEEWALVTRAVFLLAPSGTMSLRITVHRAVPAGTVMSLCATLTPVAADGLPAVARLAFERRLPVTKVLVLR